MLLSFIRTRYPSLFLLATVILVWLSCLFYIPNNNDNHHRRPRTQMHDSLKIFRAHESENIIGTRSDFMRTLSLN